VATLTHATGQNPDIDSHPSPQSLAIRLEAVDWSAASGNLAVEGNFVIPNLLSGVECRELCSAFWNDEVFGRRILLEQKGLGRGEVKYFGAQAIEPVTSLRDALYRHLSPIAMQWSAAMHARVSYPVDLSSYSLLSRAAGQTMPMSSLSRYVESDYEGVHQVADGEVVFPLQAAVMLSRPNQDFEGGEFVMTEQRPRMQSRPLALSLRQGDAVVFATSYRPFKGSSGVYRVNLRHGVSRVRYGERMALSIVFHDGE
jgi:hypothetical protein